MEEKMSFKIDESKAKEAARRFLGQYYNVIDTEAVLEDNVWLVTTYLGSTSSQRRIVRIDADSGKILGYT
ncbi:MAG TPA: PepSY domain-containing protein [Candidatus Nitrosotalea sp.]|nr:PepSY domain-containing protein [Candidatus Nitrosotalea sp.]